MKYCHKMSSTDRKPHLCFVCSEALADLDGLLLHKEECKDGKPNLCNMRGKALTDLDSLITHKEEYVDRNLYLCHVCGESFTDMDKHLKSHKISETNEEPFLCDVCGEAVTDLDKHLESHSVSIAMNVQTGALLNPGNCNCLSWEQCGTDSVQNKTRSELRESNSSTVASENEKMSNKYNRSFSKYRQVMYHKIVRKYRRYGSKMYSPDTVKTLKLKQSHSKGRKNNISVGGEKGTGTGEKPFHCVECGKHFGIHRH